jgi:hypothetical protein
MSREEITQEASSDTDNSYSLNSWMADLHPYIKHLAMGDLSLPGAHNAGADKDVMHNDNYHACQDKDVRHQLDNGVRVLDLRLMWFNGNPGGFAEKMTAYHGASGRTLGQVKTAIKQFQQVNPGEIVIVDVHKMNAWGNFSVPYKSFYDYVLSEFRTHLLPFSASRLTLDQIKLQYPGPRIIFATPKEVWEVGAPLRDRTYFWNEIEHNWIGKDLVSVAEVKQYIESTLNYTNFRNLMVSTSATAYNIAEGAVDFIGDLKRWYPAGGDWQQKSNIINFDWCTRSNEGMIRQCIESNSLKQSYHLSIATPRQGDVFRPGNVLVTGRGVPGATVKLMRGGYGGNYGEGQVDAVGEWKITANFIEEGLFPLTCTQRLNGEESDYANDVDFSIISTPVISWPDNNSEIITLRPTVSGSNATPGATVRFYQAGSGAVLYGTAAVGGNGNWSGTFTVDVPQSPFELTCDQVIGGITSNYSLTAHFKIIFPAPKIVTPADGSSVTILKPLISGESGVRGATVRFLESGGGNTVFGTALVGADGKWSGSFTVDVPRNPFGLTCDQVINGIGSNYASPIHFNIIYPAPKINAPASGSSVTTVKPPISGEDGVPGATVRFYESNVGSTLYGTARVETDGKWHSEPSVPLPAKVFSLVCDQFGEDWQSGYSLPTTFTVIEKPVTPGGLSVSALATSAQISWGNSDPYTVSYVYRLEGVPPDKVTFERTVTVDGLTADTPYTATVFAVNNLGVRSDPASFNFKTLVGQGFPTNFHVISNERRTISFAWGPPRDGAETVIGYRFKIFVTGNTTDIVQTSHTINNLIVGLPMVVGVQCRFAGGGESTWNQITVTPKA